MQDKEFNLLEEPWIKVLGFDLEIHEVSLIEALIHAQNYKALAGEMPTQDVAMLRLLLACALTVFYRYDADGDVDVITEDENDSDDVIERWSDYWERGSLPENAVRGYLKQYEERFWLFHPETPFYQVADLQYGTNYGLKCLYGNIQESNHDKGSINNKATKHHFSLREGEELQKMQYAEAARWLLHLNGFGVNVKNNKRAPGTTNTAGVGRLGKLGLIYVDAMNLFELLMLNLTPLKSGSELWSDPRPIWEMPVRTQQSIEITAPNNLPELYTLQSRRLFLKRDQGVVIGFRAMNGDYYSYEDDFNEQMTLWKHIEKDKKTHQLVYIPCTHSPEIQAWREFPTIFNTGDSGRTPGVVEWLDVLRRTNLYLPYGLITFCTVGIRYDEVKSSYTYVDCLSDGLTLSSKFLRTFDKGWLTRISDEIDKCSQVIETVFKPFSKNMEFLLNQDKLSNRIREELARKYYSQIDQPFRNWLMSIDPDSGEMETFITRWEGISYRCAEKVLLDYIDSLDSNIYKVRETDKRVISVPEMYRVCIWKLRNIYPNTRIQTGEEEGVSVL